jgi:hypothetical protein
MSIFAKSVDSGDTCIFACKTKDGRQLTVYQNSVCGQSEAKNKEKNAMIIPFPINRNILVVKDNTADLSVFPGATDLNNTIDRDVVDQNSVANTNVVDQNGVADADAVDENSTDVPENTANQSNVVNPDILTNTIDNSGMDADFYEDVKLIDISDNKEFFSDIDNLFRTVKFGSKKKANDSQLKVDCVDYKITIIYDFASINHISKDEFSIDEEVKTLLKEEYGVGFGFLICKFNSIIGMERHPIAYVHDLAGIGKDQLFIPLKHKNEQDKVNEFKHKIFTINADKNQGAGIPCSSKRKEIIPKLLIPEFKDIIDTNVVLNLRRLVLDGLYENEDRVFKFSPDVPATLNPTYIVNKNEDIVLLTKNQDLLPKSDLLLSFNPGDFVIIDDKGITTIPETVDPQQTIYILMRNDLPSSQSGRWQPYLIGNDLPELAATLHKYDRRTAKLSTAVLASGAIFKYKAIDDLPFVEYCLSIEEPIIKPEEAIKNKESTIDRKTENVVTQSDSPRDNKKKKELNVASKPTTKDKPKFPSSKSQNTKKIRSDERIQQKQSINKLASSSLKLQYSDKQDEEEDEEDDD